MLEDPILTAETMMLVSVIIPVFNGARFLSRAIDSALSQTLAPHEVIVVDDGSTDETPDVIARYGSRIRSARIPNSGPAGARNQGIRMATGQAIAFLDADDVWFKDKLRYQVEALERYPEAGMVVCDFAVRYPHLRYRMMRHSDVLRNRAMMNFDSPLREDPFKLLMIEHFVGTASAAVIRKDIIDRVGFFNPEYRSSQDYDYWLRVSLLTNITVLSQVLFYKKNHPANISADPERTHRFRRLLLTNTIRDHAGAIARKRIGHICRLSLSECDLFRGNLEYEAGRRTAAFRLYILALTEYPHPAVIKRFVWTAGKKILRLASFGLLSRKRFRRIYARA